MFNTVKLFYSKNIKIARENLTIDEPEGQQHEWRRLVGSIRRRVQRHASNTQEATTSKAQTPSPTLPRKNSLTQSRFDFFKRDKSRDESSDSAKEQGSSKNEKKEAQRILTKQKSIEGSKGEYFKGLSFKEKNKSVSVKNVHTLQSPTTSGKAGRGEKMKDSEKKVTIKSNLSKTKSAQKEEKNRDDFLKATMRIFLVVSPPVGKMQVNFQKNFKLDFLLYCFFLVSCFKSG